MTITLRDVDKTNWEECVCLELTEAQEDFVDPNWFSLLESKYEENVFVKAIYNNGDKMIGFLMYDANPDYKNIDSPRIEMCRLMIDKNHQKNGYGRKAIEELISLIRNKYGNIKFYTSIDPKNKIARHLYESIGFKKTGEIEYDEEVFAIQL